MEPSDKGELDQYVRDFLGPSKALTWWYTPNPLLGEVSPRDMLRTDRTRIKLYDFIREMRAANSAVRGTEMRILAMALMMLSGCNDPEFNSCGPHCTLLSTTSSGITCYTSEGWEKYEQCIQGANAAGLAEWQARDPAAYQSWRDHR